MEETTSPGSVANQEKLFPTQLGALQQEHAPATAGRPVEPNMEKVEDYVDDKIEIRENDCYGSLGYKFSTLKKWYIITIVFWVQVISQFAFTNNMALTRCRCS